MSIASLQNEWLKDAPARIPLGRASAKSTLIARHNYKGESVFQARRQWHSSRAYADAAHRRLVAAMAELEAARRGEEEAELAALRAMGIGIRSQLLSPDGRRPSSSSSTAPQGALSDPGPRRTTTGGSRLPPGKGGADPLAAWKASDARAAWIAKKQTAPVAATATQIFVPEMTKPKRGGKAETTRD
eukprot:jgi/Chrpa1/11864/Chrysochromulina_OHIO_Genome00021144-RA